jgi:phosphoenolpyruvate carboxykinase (GTP)
MVLRMDTSHFGAYAPKNDTLRAWVEEVRSLVTPDRIFWVNGSEEEKDLLYDRAVADGVLIKLNQEKLPGCYYHRSNSNDVARVEQFTFICTPAKDEAGPTNNWAAPREMYTKLFTMLQGAMKGRTMYVVPYLMGPPGSPLTKIGVEITDSIYVVLNMRIMSRMGKVALDQLGNGKDFNRGIHSVLDCNPDRRFICHFPQDNTIISVGSGYGGNVLLGKKCLALRIGSYLARQQGWMAEHMLILCVESPDGEKSYVTAAFPSSCGKTNFAMLIPPKEFAGWKITTIGDDIAWMKPGQDGRLYAINPEAGYFGVAPGTNRKSNPNAMDTIAKDTIFTNVALKPDGTVWWEGHDDPAPTECLDWKGEPWTPESKEKAAHPNSRFTAPMTNNPALAPEAQDPQGVPISAIIFGGRRASTMPLIFQSFNWIHGVYLGATMGSEMTAAAAGTLGQVRRDPMAMLPFCGYNMGDYFNHWLGIRRELTDPPRIFHVNWFRKDGDDKFYWPGFGENFRVLKWIIDRTKGRTRASETQIGWMPRYSEFDWSGLDFPREKFQQVMRIDSAEWRRELISQTELFLTLHDRLPKELIFQRELLVSRL